MNYFCLLYIVTQCAAVTKRVGLMRAPLQTTCSRLLSPATHGQRFTGRVKNSYRSNSALVWLKRGRRPQTDQHKASFRNILHTKEIATYSSCLYLLQEIEWNQELVNLSRLFLYEWINMKKLNLLSELIFDGWQKYFMVFAITGASPYCRQRPSLWHLNNTITHNKLKNRWLHIK